MNLNERGLTIGDLLLILIFIISIFLITNKIKNKDKQAHLNINSFEVIGLEKSNHFKKGTQFFFHWKIYRA